MLSLLLPGAEADYIVTKARERTSIWITGGTSARRAALLSALVASVGGALAIGALAEHHGEHPCVRGHRRSITLRLAPEVMANLHERGSDYGHLLTQQLMTVALVTEPSEVFWPAVREVGQALPLWLASDLDRSEAWFGLVVELGERTTRLISTV